MTGDAAATNAALLVTLESYAAEGRWTDVGLTLKRQGEPTGAAFAYYRAAVKGDFAEAAKLLRASGDAEARAEARMLEADLLLKAGDRKGAERAWRDVSAATNASERALTMAAVNLMDGALLQRAYEKTTSADLRRLAGLRLGRVLLTDKATQAEGAKMIRGIVKDSPDAEGARDCFLAIAEADLRAERWQDAAKVYRDAIEIWPDVARRASVQDGIGWTSLKLGRREAALEAFRQAEKVAEGDVARASAVAKQGDVLAEMGRGDEAMARYRVVLDKFAQTEIAQCIRRIVKIREMEDAGREAFRGYRFSDAQKAFAAVAAEDPSRCPRMDYFDVLCLYGQGLDARAEERARILSETCSNAVVKADATLWLAKFSYNRGEWKKARSLFNAYAEMSGVAAAGEALLWSARAAFSESDYAQAIQTATRLLERDAASPLRHQAMLVQGEALIEMARFDEAVLVLDRVAAAEGAQAEDRRLALRMKADALYAMGADNPARYSAALEAYRSIRFGGALTPAAQIVVSFKIARTLEKLKRMDEAVDQYYTQVVLAYRDGRLKGDSYDDEARAAFSRAAFRLADEYESRGRDFQTMRVLELVVESDVPAAAEAARRIKRISAKGRLL